MSFAKISSSVRLQNCSRCLSTSAVLNKVQVGRYKPTRYRTKPLTYEMSQLPEQIGRTKAWLTWHTHDLYDFNTRQPQMVLQDALIRKFIQGIWITRFNIFASEIIIKRRGNVIIIGGIVNTVINASKMYWLIGYTEELLSIILKQPVKMELQTIKNKSDIVFKYI